MTSGSGAGATSYASGDLEQPGGAHPTADAQLVRLTSGADQPR